MIHLVFSEFFGRISWLRNVVSHPYIFPVSLIDRTPKIRMWFLDLFGVSHGYPMAIGIAARYRCFCRRTRRHRRPGRYDQRQRHRSHGPWPCRSMGSGAWAMVKHGETQGPPIALMNNNFDKYVTVIYGMYMYVYCIMLRSFGLFLLSFINLDSMMLTFGQCCRML